MKDRVPLVYFHAVVPGRYLCVWPAFVIGDDPGRLTFTVAVDDTGLVNGTQLDVGGSADGASIARDQRRRAYITASVRKRLHQRGFRERILMAYKEQCAFCRLKLRELLDAAHIVPDAEELGDPTVSNGLSLCKLHHAAFDNNVVGLRPNYQIEVRPDILKKDDGPMLIHGLKELQGKTIFVPEKRLQRPDPLRLEARYEEFREAV